MVFQKLLLSACTSQLPDRGGLAVGINTTQANISTCHLATRVSLCLANFQLWGYRCDRLFRKRALEGLQLKWRKPFVLTQKVRHKHETLIFW